MQTFEEIDGALKPIDKLYSVIWTTSSKGFMINGVPEEKSEVGLIFHSTKGFTPIAEWISAHDINLEWFKANTQGLDVSSWYVSEEAQKINRCTPGFREDVLERMKKFIPEDDDMFY